MQTLRKHALLASVAAAGLFATPALAAPVAGTLSFTITGFEASAPQPTLSGAIALTFDPMVVTADTTAGLVVQSLNFSPASAVAFNYDPVQDILNIGGIAAGVEGFAASGNDFQVTIQNLFNGKTVQVLGIYGSEPNVFASFFEGSASFEVPEPASMTLFGLGLLGLAGVARRRKG